MKEEIWQQLCYGVCIEKWLRSQSERLFVISCMKGYLKNVFVRLVIQYTKGCLRNVFVSDVRGDV